MASCDEILQSCRAWIGDKLQITSLGSSCLLRMPFFDPSGDPITVVISDAPDGYSVHDGGVVAGHLFSLGQHTENTQAFKLIDRLCSTYKFTLDRNQGLIRTEVSAENLADAVFDLTKVIVTMTTATAHIAVQPHRFRTLGARVRRKVRDHYAKRNILEWVEPYYEIRGRTVDAWPIDFHWKIREGNTFKDVFISTVDLNVNEPIRKVEHITALAIDAYTAIEGHDLRVVLDKHGQNSVADVAANYLEEHRGRLGYTLYDFGNDDSRERFIEQSEHEVLGQAGNEWRAFWDAARHGQIAPADFGNESFDKILQSVARPLNPPPNQESEET